MKECIDYKNGCCRAEEERWGFPCKCLNEDYKDGANHCVEYEIKEEYTCKDCIWYIREKPLEPERYYCMELLRERKKIIHIEAEQPICMAFEHNND